MAIDDLVQKLGIDTGTKKYAGIIDTISANTYSVIVGGAIDIASGANWQGVLGSRGSAALLNTFTGGIYGVYQDILYTVTSTTEESSWLKKRAVDLFAFNTFQVPIYGLAKTIGGLIQTSGIDTRQIKDGMEYLALMSPFIGPTMKMTMNYARKLAGARQFEEK